MKVCEEGTRSFDEMKVGYVPDLRTYSITLEGWGDE